MSENGLAKIDDLARGDASELALDPHAMAHEQPDGIENELLILFAGTKSYGREVGGPAIAAWTVALRSAQVILGELQIAVEYWIARVGGDTPEPKSLIDWIIEQRTDVELRFRMRESIRRRREEEEAEMRKRNLDVYGTEYPDRDQIQSRLLGYFEWVEVGPTARELRPRRSFNSLPGRTSNAEEDARAERVRAQADAMRRGDL